MQFRKNTSISKSSSILRLTVKLGLIILLFFFVVVLLNKIEFPSPNKEIEKIVPNEKLKVVK
jgi:flagellar biogenesis protein FliO